MNPADTNGIRRRFRSGRMTVAQRFNAQLDAALAEIARRRRDEVIRFIEPGQEEAWPAVGKRTEEA